MTAAAVDWHDCPCCHGYGTHGTATEHLCRICEGAGTLTTLDRDAYLNGAAACPGKEFTPWPATI